MKVSETIKNIRIQLGLTKVELAELLHIDASSLSCYEHGTRRPRIPRIRAIVEFAHKNGIDIKYSDLYEG